MIRRLPNLETQERAVSRVEELVRKVAAALDTAGVPYAVIGGNAVAAWIATVDSDAVRATKDVDILVQRADVPKMAKVLAPLDLIPEEVLGLTVFVDRQNPRPSAGVHVIFANERVRPHSRHPAPDVSGTVQAASGFKVLDLPSLLVMKLEAFRRIDQVHVEDLLRSGLIDKSLAERLPEDLRNRLREVRDTMEWFTEPPSF